MTSSEGEHALSSSGEPTLWSRCAHEVIESIVDQYPDRIALVCGTDRLTYAELDQRSNAVAFDLIECGLNPGEVVALAMRRSTQLFVSLLGVLKAGGVYVPVDPSHPASRNQRILNLASPRMVLSESGSISTSEWLQGYEVIDVGSASARSLPRPRVPGSADDLAYILFTSGSTGEPKGVPIKHDGISRLVLGQSYAPFGPELSWLKLAPMSFDASTIEIYGAWMWGAALVVWDRDEIDAEEIASLIERESVRACFTSFGLFSTLLDACPRFYDQIQLVITGSEPVLPGVIRRAARKYPEMQIVVAYGPTEATAFTTTYQTNDLDESLPTVPLGKPLNGLFCRLINKTGDLVAQGEAGEVCIGGVGVTPGYLDRPDLNERSFLADPLDPSRRLYRSGDLAKELDSGDLIFLGRLDSQVKVRGNRVELGEIESVVERMPGVHRAAAAVAGEGAGQHVVVGVVSIEHNFDVSMSARHIASVLPEYMVPNQVGRIVSVPYTENGKVDRQHVAELVRQQQSAESDGRMDDLSTTEMAIAAVWKQVVGADSVRRTDSFLAIGGHSLRAMVTCSRLNRQFGVRLTAPKLLELGQLSNVADWLEREKNEIESSRVEERLGKSQLSHAQQQLWVFDQMTPHDATYTITVRLTFDEELDRDAYELACRALIDRHEALRTGFHESSDGPFRRLYASDGDGPLGFDIRWHESHVDSPKDFASQFAREPFDLAHPPLIRFAVHRDGDQHVVLIGMHHIVTDGWSASVIRRDFIELYRSFREQVQAVLPALPEDPSGLLAAKFTREEVDWWENHLEALEPVSLPSERAGTHLSVCSGVHAVVDAPGYLLRRIRDLATKLGVSRFVIFNAAYHIWLHRVSRNEDLTVGTPVACREVSGLENAVGFFMTSLPIRTSVRSCDTGEDVIRAVNRSYRDSESRKSVPLQKILDTVSLPYVPGRNPLFEVFFNYISMDYGAGDQGLSIENIEVDNGTSKFDLTCYVFESDVDLRIKLNARASVADELALRRWADQIMRVLESLVEDTTLPIGSFGLLSASEAMAFEQQKSNPLIPYEGSSNAWVRFTEIAHRFPNHQACVTPEKVVSYQELREGAERIARGLALRGVLAGDRILCRSGKSSSMAESVLGVLACGACYVPIDMAWPARRIEEIASVTSAKIMLSDDPAPDLGCETVSLLELQSNTDSKGEVQSAFDQASDQISDAYILFTSGTTGTPCGVIQTHAGLCEQMEVFADSVGMTEHDRVGMTSSHAFDSAVMDMFGAWFRGAAWCPISLESADESGIMQAIDEAGITVLHAAPSVLRTIVSGDVRCEMVRGVVLGGEPASSADLVRIETHFPACALVVNGMGMSESSLTVQWRGRPGASVESTRLPIGAATPGVSIRLLDLAGEETDAVGQLEIESRRIARGVLQGQSRDVTSIGRLTSEGTTRFATGDLVRVRPDGMLEHIGRCDQQVKVSGVRIEPEEVRAAICNMEGVQDAAIVTDYRRRFTDAEPEQILCAAVVQERGRGLDGSAIRSALTDQLPRAMLPTRIVVVEALPRTGGGKVNVHAVRDLCQQSGDVSQVSGDAPVGMVRVITEVFAQVLGRDSVGPSDDFFAIGGSSLAALRAFAKLREKLGTNLPVITMFRAPTAEQLASIIRSDPDAGGERAIVPLSSPDGDAAYFLPGIGGNPHSFAPVVDRLSVDHACLGFQLPGVLGELEPLESIEAQAELFLKSVGVEELGVAPPLVGYSYGGSLALEVALRWQRRGVRPGPVIFIDAHFMPGLKRKGARSRAVVHALEFLKGSGGSRRAYLSKRLKTQSKVRRLGGVYETDRSLESIRRLILANRVALNAYRPAEQYQGNVLLFRARQPDWIRFHHDDKVNGWRAAVGGNIRVVEMDVEHNRVLHQQCSELLEAEIRRELGSTSG
ncbi:MAG: amino acid adenylation domain-containing protein [Phycisphaerales bacterium]